VRLVRPLFAYLMLRRPSTSMFFTGLLGAFPDTQLWARCSSRADHSPNPLPVLRLRAPRQGRRFLPFHPFPGGFAPFPLGTLPTRGGNTFLIGQHLPVASACGPPKHRLYFSQKEIPRTAPFQLALFLPLPIPEPPSAFPPTSWGRARFRLSGTLLPYNRAQG